jgi:hypothetical protein
VHAHAHALVADVVALHEVVGATRAGEGQRTQEQRDAQPRLPGREADAVGDERAQASPVVAAGIAMITKSMINPTSTPWIFSTAW